MRLQSRADVRVEDESKIRWVKFCSCDFARRDDGGKEMAPLNGATRTRGKTVSWRGLRSFHDDNTGLVYSEQRPIDTANFVLRRRFLR